MDRVTSDTLLEDGILEEFRTFLQSDTVCRFNFEKRRFYFKERIKQWMTHVVTRNRTQVRRAILLLNAVYRHKNWLPVASGSIISESCLVFAILLNIDCGHMIGDFETRIKDNHLNFSDLSQAYEHIRRTMENCAESKPSLPERFKDSGYQGVIDEFETQRWAFATDPLQIDTNAAFDEGKHILPFKTMERIKPGGTAVVYYCQIQSDFISEGLAEVLTMKTNPQLGNYYEIAVKSYMAWNGAIYEMERDAYMGMRGQEGVVKYLGAYQVNGKDNEYHIMLEYCEKDLEDYLTEMLPPILSDEFIRFWGNLFKVADTLKSIHQLEHKGEDGFSRVFRGWHGDVKPSNVLCKGEEFKLADFGFTKFEEHNEKTRLPGGTRSYGAPERDFRGSMSRNISLSQTVDTWSFGCLLSDAATWAILGCSFYTNYSCIRVHSIRGLRDRHTIDPSVSIPESDDAFHDGKRVLPAVLDWHDHLRNSTRKSDTISWRVLDLIDEGMLLEDPEMRLTSAELCGRLDEIVYQAETDYRNGIASDSLKRESQALLNTLLDLDITAPATPSQANRSTSSSSTLWSDPKMSDLGPAKLSRKMKSARFSRKLIAKTSNRERVIKSSIYPVDETHEPITEVPYSPAASMWSWEDPEKQLHWEPKAEVLDHTAGEEMAKQNVVSNQETDNPNTGLFRARSRQPTLEALENPASTFANPVNNRYTLHDSVNGAPQLSAEPAQDPDINEARVNPRSDLASPDNYSIRYDSTDTSRVISAVEEEYHRLTKYFRSGSGSWYTFNTKPQKKAYLESFFLNRDIKFVVDNAFSMKPHWEDVKMTLLVLALKLGSLNKGGLDLLYTIGRKQSVLNAKGKTIERRFRRSIEDTYKAITSFSKTDMAQTLSEIFANYKNTQRKQTLFVLTNGLWEGSCFTDDVENCIRDFINKLRQKDDKIECRWFSIQFITFGDDEKALRRLQSLDDDLHTIEDVVDTKPWDLNDINMLILGSITEAADEATASSTPLSPPFNPSTPFPPPTPPTLATDSLTLANSSSAGRRNGPISKYFR
ncbi:hypothetical protein G7046_g4895 [Stylonectria norvegica]|nr:hypothetical protein G7046_g4895 [Stylonectria norvegica]